MMPVEIILENLTYNSKEYVFHYRGEE